MSAKIIRFPKPIPEYSRIERAEEKLIAYMLQSPEQAYKIIEFMKGKQFRYEENQAIYTYLIGFYEEFEQAEPSEFLSFICSNTPSLNLRKKVAHIQMLPINEDSFTFDKDIKDYWSVFLKR